MGRLKALEVRSAREGRHGDCDGLMLLVKPSDYQILGICGAGLGGQAGRLKTSS